ncbi:MAG TPA: NAD(P)H-dependent oxidoreductase [Ideonella sp.]|nr:NAD(P)H-dependent oxidoreductase [Ideonella sp.]
MSTIGLPAVRVLVVSGSQRTGSHNLKLAALAAAVARTQGAAVTEVDLRALALPLYDADLEARHGQPAGALELRRLFATHDALLVAAPEYNGFVTPLLVNALDWASRPKAEGEWPDGLAAMNGTAVGLMSASPGQFGGVRGLIALRSLVSLTLAMHVVPPTLSVARAAEAFDAAGQLKDERHREGLERVVATTLRTAAGLRLVAG